MLRTIFVSLILAASLSIAGCARRAPVEPALFSCGAIMCDARSSYCETINTDVPALPSTYACKPLPSACQPPVAEVHDNCGCFPPGTRCQFCTTRAQGTVQAFYRTCVGGG